MSDKNNHPPLNFAFRGNQRKLQIIAVRKIKYILNSHRHDPQADSNCLLLFRLELILLSRKAKAYLKLF